MNDDRGVGPKWGDAPAESPRSRAPRWAVAVALGAFAVIALLIALPSLAPRPIDEGAVDPLGFISPPDAASDAPQRVFDQDVLEAARQREKYLGVDACRECHAARVAEYEQTSHYLTSRRADDRAILGPLAGDKAHVATPNPQLTFHIEPDGAGGRQQRAVVEHRGSEFEYARTIDIAIGSGLHAQTFLSWEADRLYQLPLTYSAELDEWVKSPGYPAGLAIYSRAASSGCLRCHATYLKERDDAWNSYDPASAIWGISCEKCHGAGESHVRYRRGPGEKSLEDDPIVRPAALTRQRQLEICAQCHAGVGQFQQPPFSYRPGDPLEAFIKQERLEDQQFGVHSTNQLARLQRSKCFGGASGSMTCTTCHNPHAKEASLVDASKSCMKCHQPERCSKHAKWGERIETRCVDCHMPTAFDLEADLATRDEITFPRMRDHFIARYPELSSKVEAGWRRSE